MEHCHRNNGEEVEKTRFSKVGNVSYYQETKSSQSNVSCTQNTDSTQDERRKDGHHSVNQSDF